MSKSHGGDQLARDARIALPVLGLLILVFAGTAYRRFTGWGDPPPANIRDATIADENNGDPASDRGTSQRGDAVVPPVLRRETNDRSPAVIAPVTESRSGDSVNPAQLRSHQPASNSNGTERGNPAPTQPRRQLSNPSDLIIPTRPLIESRETGVTVEVTVDDSYWSLCERAYGSGQYFRALHSFAQDHPNLERNLLPGRRTVLPSAAELRRLYADLCPSQNQATRFDNEVGFYAEQTYTTQGDETLFELSAQLLGQASRYPEILAANRDVLGGDVGANDRLPRGIRLVLPQR